ncbi:hypothetical protein BT93_B2080 [Corymbia citriodora subsp. variegata]|nr:hypothetical protein BT93_B2080 [Corymbia citriodora subsp. variegata]
MFGAVGDGVADDTEALKMALDAACSSLVESPVLYVPSGYSFMVQSTIFTGPCQGGIVFQVYPEKWSSKQCRNFRINGMLMSPVGPGSWPKGLSRRQWLAFHRVISMLLQGDGLIDGKGEKWEEMELHCLLKKKNGTTLPAPCDSPIAIRFFMSSNLTLKGLKIRNSPSSTSSLIIAEMFTLIPSSPNTDGIHIENTTGVKIYNSVISNASPQIHINTLLIICILLHNCITTSCLLFLVNVTIVFSWTWQGGSRAVSGVTFDNIRMYNVRNPA